MSCLVEFADLLTKTLAGYDRQIKVGDVVRHFKGNVYEVIAIGLSSDALEPMVVYKGVDNGVIWIRTYEEFVSNAPDQQMPRFEKVDSVEDGCKVQMNVPMTKFYSMLNREQKAELRQLVLADAGSEV